MCRELARFLDGVEDVVRVTEDLIDFFQMPS